VPGPITAGVKVILPVTGLVTNVLLVWNGLLGMLSGGVCPVVSKRFVGGEEQLLPVNGFNISVERESPFGSIAPLLYVVAWFIQAYGTGLIEK
jgi:hypothetical protein